MSYVIEVYKRRQKAERNFGIFALYVMFYPQLVAGPIERPQNLLHQFNEKHFFNVKDVQRGLALMLGGFFLKVVVADRFAVFVNIIYDNPQAYSGLPLIIATILFSFQIFCDFYGYSLIAIGSARVMGFHLMKNFDKPYLATSIPDFWRRWHISLSTWFRDYIYFPLGGSRVPILRTCFNLLVVFMISGLWHGANWTYIVWGGLHGIFMIASVLTQKMRGRLAQFFARLKLSFLHVNMQRIITYALVCFAWIFFRSNSLSDSIYIITHLFSNFGFSISQNGVPGLGLLMFMYCLFLILVIQAISLCIGGDLFDFVSQKSKVFQWSIYLSIVIFILLFGQFSGSKFIYFQF